MTEVHTILSPNRATQRMLRHRSAVMTLARMRAKKAVLLELRAQGLKPQHFSRARDCCVDRLLSQSASGSAHGGGCGGDCYVARICSLALACLCKCRK